MSLTNQPLYQQVAEKIQERIGSGEFPPGSMMMSEAAAQKEYNVSRVTVRKAFGSLIDKGILRTIRGKGTFVNDVETQDWTWMKSFSREVLASGHVPTTKLIKFRIMKADAQIANRLMIEEGVDCFYLKRIRCIDNKPVWLTKSYIPYALVPELTRDHFSVAGMAQSIFRVIDLNFGIKAVRGEEIQEAVNIPEKDAPYLGIQTNKPVISKAFVAYNEQGMPIIYENTVFEQSISHFSMKM